jgi:hemerythrin-like metal-binding protein
MSQQRKECVGGISHSRIGYVGKKHGQNGMNQLLNNMVAMGYTGPRDLKDIKIAKWYPMEYNILFLKAYLELFGKANFKKMAMDSANKKGVIGVFLKWAGSPDLLIKKSGDYWNKFYNFGRLEGKLIDTHSGIIHGYDVSLDPIFCDYLTDYFTGVALITSANAVMVEHIKCVHEGDDHCEWSMTWESVNKGGHSAGRKLQWDDSLNTGVEGIDTQHKYFIRILDEINKSITANTRSATLRALRFMDYYAHWHFTVEEKYMLMYDYPDYETHRKEHQAFYDHTQEIIRHGEENAVANAFSINKYLIDWLLSHIKGSDMKFAEFLRNKNLDMGEDDIPADIREKMEGIGPY